MGTMKRFIMNSVIFLAVMNLASYAGTLITGRPYSFGIFSDIVVPLCCAGICTVMEAGRGKSEA